MERSSLQPRTEKQQKRQEQKENKEERLQIQNQKPKPADPAKALALLGKLSLGKKHLLRRQKSLFQKRKNRLRRNQKRGKNLAWRYSEKRRKQLSSNNRLLHLGRSRVHRLHSSQSQTTKGPSQVLQALANFSRWCKITTRKHKSF